MTSCTQGPCAQLTQTQKGFGGTVAVFVLLGGLVCLKVCLVCPVQHQCWVQAKGGLPGKDDAWCEYAQLTCLDSSLGV